MVDLARRRALVDEARRLLAAAAAIGGLLIVSTVSAASVLPLPINSDPYTNTSSQHQTQLEPDSFAFGNTVISVTQSGRFFNGGSSNIAWSTSQDAGRTWVHGTLPGTTATRPSPTTAAQRLDCVRSRDRRRRARRGAWSTAQQVSRAMNLSWIANTNQGRMVGDYVSTSFTADGKAHPVFAIAKPPQGGACNYTPPTLVCREQLATATFDVMGSAAGPGVSTASEKPVFRPRKRQLHPRLRTAS